MVTTAARTSGHQYQGLDSWKLDRYQVELRRCLVCREQPYQVRVTKHGYVTLVGMYATEAEARATVDRLERLGRRRM